MSSFKYIFQFNLYIHMYKSKYDVLVKIIFIIYFNLYWIFITSLFNANSRIPCMKWYYWESVIYMVEIGFKIKFEDLKSYNIIVILENEYLFSSFDTVRYTLWHKIKFDLSIHIIIFEISSFCVIYFK